MNIVKKALATTFLAALGTIANAATPNMSPNEACTTLGQNTGVYEYPAARKAFQQSGALGCEFGYGPNQQFIPLRAYNLNDSRQAQAYARAVEGADRLETRALAQQQRQMERDQRRNTINPARAIREVTRDANSIQRSIKQLERIFK